MSAPTRGYSTNTRVQTFILSGYAAHPRRGTVTIRAFNRRERLHRALTALGKWWGVALVAVFIPVAHFVLVPSFLLYGASQFVQRLGTTELATDARATCPDCDREQLLDLAPRWRAPQPVTCRYCHRGLRLSLPQESERAASRPGEALTSPAFLRTDRDISAGASTRPPIAR